MFLFNKQKYTELSDNELLQIYRKTGKQKIIAELFNRYAHLIFGVCLKYSNKNDICEDVVIQIFETVMEYAKKSEIKFLKSWLYTVTRNECFKQNKSLEKLEYNDEINEDIIDEKKAETISDKKLKEAINQLKAEQKECIELFYFEELSYNQIAEKTGYEIKKVKSNIQNGKRNLSIILKKERDEIVQ